MIMTTERSFRMIFVKGDEGNTDIQKGIYKGRGPGQAALKAFNKYCRKLGLSTCTRKFTIEEITPGKDRKLFHYIGARNKLHPPKINVRGGQEYAIHYKTTVHKAK